LHSSPIYPLPVKDHYYQTIVFGILERHGKVYTEIVPNAAKKLLQAAIRGQVALLTASSIRADGGATMGW